MTAKTKPRTKYDRERSERTPRNRGDRRFPMPTQQTQDEWSAYMQRADEVAYRLLYQSQEHELQNYDVPYNAETDNG